MRIEDAFRVHAPAGAVWGFLADPRRVTAALPGAALTRNLGGGTYEGAISMRVGPVAAAYRGTVTFVIDEETRTAVVRARGRGKVGMGNADMTMTSRVAAVSASETEVTIGADVAVTGILAQLGRGMIQHASKKMIRKFAAIVAREIAAGADERRMPVKVRTSARADAGSPRPGDRSA